MWFNNVVQNVVQKCGSKMWFNCTGTSILPTPCVAHDGVQSFLFNGAIKSGDAGSLRTGLIAGLRARDGGGSGGFVAGRGRRVVAAAAAAAVLFLTFCVVCFFILHRCYLLASCIVAISFSFPSDLRLRFVA